MIRKKLGYCIRMYGNIVYGWLLGEESCDEIWRIICNLMMFAKAIYLTLLEFKSLGKENLEDIIDCLTNQYLKYNFFEERYEIVNCPNDMMHYEHDPLYLRLYFIAYILLPDKQKLIDSFIEASFLREEEYDISEEEKERFKIFLMKECREEIVELYRKYSPTSWKNIFILRRHCEKVFLFVQTEVSDDPHRY